MTLLTLLTLGDDVYLVVEKKEPKPLDETADCGLPAYTVDVKMLIYKLNEEKREWVEVVDLPDHVFFFIGDQVCSYALSSQAFPGMRGRCVYFQENMFTQFNKAEKSLGRIGGDTGVYQLDDLTFGPLAWFRSRWAIFWPPPTWLK